MDLNRCAEPRINQNQRWLPRGAMDLNEEDFTPVCCGRGWLPRGAMDLNLFTLNSTLLPATVGSLVEPWI